MSVELTYNMPLNIIEWPSEPLQYIDKESSTKQQAIGTIYRDFSNNKTYQYGKAGAVALGKGLMQQGPAAVADHINQALTGSSAVKGATEIEIKTALSTTVSEDQYLGGEIHINDADGEGQSYTIVWHSTGTTPKFKLDRPLTEALAATSEFSLTANAGNGLIVAPTGGLTAKVFGVPVIDVTIGYYAWFQTGGRCPCVVDTSETLIAGNPVGYPATPNVAGAFGIPAITDPILGTVATVRPATEFALIDLDILR